MSNERMRLGGGGLNIVGYEIRIVVKKLEQLPWLNRFG
jgi:hypothetical protein